MTATITRYTMTVPTYTNWELGFIGKTTKTFKTEAEAECAMVAYAKENPDLVQKADPTLWQIKKTVKRVEID